MTSRDGDIFLESDDLPRFGQKQPVQSGLEKVSASVKESRANGRLCRLHRGSVTAACYSLPAPRERFWWLRSTAVERQAWAI